MRDRQVENNDRDSEGIKHQVDFEGATAGKCNFLRESRTLIGHDTRF